MGWGSSTRRGGGRKVRALPRKFVFLGFGREEPGMSRESCRDVPDSWGVRKVSAKKFGRIFSQNTLDHDKGQKSAISGRRLHWRLSTGFFFAFSPVFMCKFSKTSPVKSGESSEKSSGENRIKSCHVCGCHGFFGPDEFRSLKKKARLQRTRATQSGRQSHGTQSPAG